MKNLKRILPALTLAALLIVTLLTIPGQARACCVYNHASYPLKVQMDTGVFGSEDWTIQPTYHKCTNGEGGTVVVQVYSPDRKNMLSEIVSIKVDDHGWVSVFKKEGGSWKVESKDKNGKVKHTKSMSAW